MSSEKPQPPGDGELLLLEPKYQILTYEARLPQGNQAAPLLGSVHILCICPPREVAGSQRWRMATQKAAQFIAYRVQTIGKFGDHCLSQSRIRAAARANSHLQRKSLSLVLEVFIGPPRDGQVADWPHIGVPPQLAPQGRPDFTSFRLPLHRWKRSRCGSALQIKALKQFISTTWMVKEGYSEDALERLPTIWLTRADEHP
eukprot:s485_g13.t1